ncbi:eCIS core domain-containing protein [Actinacidiphila acididurans]|uniref:DUF4157 domain-containing protein n=1 Tax=Actinacidiphila acididurans TaxID=2784346 RepID=A0ABS2TUL6_9ACTN|nr:DUF4157 domain-containing protein [Actinacidiphila acididurans]MBM9506686.1 DUF4157 domain-containing protein [Actinacidiphila acididurans]
MRGHEEGPDHDHEHDGSPRPAEDADARTAPELPHLLKAAATGRTDVVGAAGMGVLQRLAGNSAVGSMLRREEEDEARARSSVHDVVGSGGGEPLDGGTRTDMEARLGADFGDVRVHTGGAAHDSAAEVGACAYTVGNDVVFQRDVYDPASHEGRVTLAHELTHVVQQRQGEVAGTETAGGIRVSDPGDPFEREASATAERAMSAPDPAPAPAPSPEPAPSAAPPAPAVQRDALTAPDSADAPPVQRDSAEEEDKDEETPPAG